MLAMPSTRWKMCCNKVASQSWEVKYGPRLAAHLKNFISKTYGESLHKVEAVALPTWWGNPTGGV